MQLLVACHWAKRTQWRGGVLNMRERVGTLRLLTCSLRSLASNRLHFEKKSACKWKLKNIECHNIIVLQSWLRAEECPVLHTRFVVKKPDARHEEHSEKQSSQGDEDRCLKTDSLMDGVDLSCLVISFQWAPKLLCWPTRTFTFDHWVNNSWNTMNYS